jgi:hypothetical protein
VGDGSFLRPKCGMRISPEDETEGNYQVIDTKVVNNELSELVIAFWKMQNHNEACWLSTGLETEI